jgi:hypothetical protein
VLKRTFGPRREEVKEGRKKCIMRSSIMYTLLQILLEDYSENLDVDGKLILKWILSWIGLIWLRTGFGGGSCEQGTEPWGSIKAGKFLTT